MSVIEIGINLSQGRFSHVRPEEKSHGNAIGFIMDVRAGVSHALKSHIASNNRIVRKTNERLIGVDLYSV